ncbi:uncharacterized protein KNAG_0C01240 [Huiozyma naganishii CBS 8797]|uniref:Uncharacterized protein n=1 Tax=Huiozyma naganishii (strain ATCC MYA-139 / BCRC 22969 / CBS 8797 / KCTC 17520 / NBRC 10181 / NCYC 3082 / Yp74L-3) TaxID=1071383 RepID=J7RW70_HUIN7|nr:hypothetical protein KNAG_0C01240 [Kazachstania naganishii CBS 8797]CCK69237.1 hypothetical protein KNAG_0C01240 [Kazachstania naganishii CBS 8797]
MYLLYVHKWPTGRYTEKTAASNVVTSLGPKLVIISKFVNLNTRSVRPATHSSLRNEEERIEGKVPKKRTQCLKTTRPCVRRSNQDRHRDRRPAQCSKPTPSLEDSQRHSSVGWTPLPRKRPHAGHARFPKGHLSMSCYFRIGTRSRKTRSDNLSLVVVFSFLVTTSWPCCQQLQNFPPHPSWSPARQIGGQRTHLHILHIYRHRYFDIISVSSLFVFLCKRL